MSDVLVRARTVATSALTWLTVAAFVAAAAVPQLAEILGADHPAVTIAGQVVVVLGAVIAMIRRVTPVPGSEHGLLPSPPLPVGMVEIVATTGFQHAGKLFEQGAKYRVDPTDAGYFVGVGWAALAHTLVAPADVTVSTSTEVR